MRKAISVLLSAFLLLFAAGCSQNSVSSQNNAQVTSSQNESAAESLPPVSSTVSENAAPAELGNVLITYFSWADNTTVENPDEVDAVASPSLAAPGDVRVVADIIQSQVGGDIAPILTVEPYSNDFDTVVAEARQERQSDTLPSLQPMEINLDEYDTVFLGFPIWSSTIPGAVDAFLTEYDLSGKTVIPFCTHDGYGAGRSNDDIAALSPNSTLLEGFVMPGADVRNNGEAEVASWLEGITGGTGNTTDDAAQTPIRITIGELELDGYLNDTAVAQEFMQTLPVTIPMGRFTDREYYGVIEQPLTAEGDLKTTFFDGDLTYCPQNNTVAIFFDQAGRPNLGMEVISMGLVTSGLGVFAEMEQSVDVTIELA